MAETYKDQLILYFKWRINIRSRNSFSVYSVNKIHGLFIVYTTKTQAFILFVFIIWTKATGILLFDVINSVEVY